MPPYSAKRASRSKIGQRVFTAGESRKGSKDRSIAVSRSDCTLRQTPCFLSHSCRMESPGTVGNAQKSLVLHASRCDKKSRVLGGLRCISVYFNEVIFDSGRGI
jgi:hypothetical protein